jgi:hypothetical protein
VWLQLHPREQAERIYTAPGVLWSDMYVNFGWLGVLLSGPIIGIFLKQLQAVLDSIHVDALRAALTAFASVYAMNVVTKGPAMLFGLPFDYYVLVVAFASIGIVAADRRHRNRRARLGAGTAPAVGGARVRESQPLRPVPEPPR